MNCSCVQPLIRCKLGRRARRLAAGKVLAVTVSAILEAHDICPYSTVGLWRRGDRTSLVLDRIRRYGAVKMRPQRRVRRRRFVLTVAGYGDRLPPTARPRPKVAQVLCRHDIRGARCHRRLADRPQNFRFDHLFQFTRRRQVGRVQVAQRQPVSPQCSSAAQRQSCSPMARRRK